MTTPDDPQTPSDEPTHTWAETAVKNAGTLVLLGVTLFLGMAIGRCGPEDHRDDSEHAHDAIEDESQHWTCSMHPQIRMEHEGQCPICGMNLIPAQSPNSSVTSGRETVTLSPRAVALAQIRTSQVERTRPQTEVRLLGRVDYDETRLRMVTPWTNGRIDKLRVRVTGTTVRKGQVVAELYSPELYAGMRDLIVAGKQSKRLSAGMHGSGALATAALDSAREKLRLLGVSEKELKSIETSGKAPKKVSIRSPFSGTVLKRNVEEGDYVKSGTALYHIADLSKVWVQIDAYESDLPLLAPGNEVRIEIDALPGEMLSGEVAFIDPVVDERTRTTRVRVEVPNPTGALRPGMFAEAVINAGARDQSRQLVLPRSAVLFTGRRSVVYVAIPEQPGAYALREVRLGTRAGPVYTVLSGISEGEQVVTHGAFSLDADLQLRGGASMMTRPDDAASEHRVLIVDAPTLAALRPVLEAYLDAQEQLATDDFDQARTALRTLAEAANAAKLPAPRATRDAWQEVASALSGHGQDAASAEDQAQVRRAFEEVSAAIATLLSGFGNPSDAAVRVAYCPMAFDNAGAQWVQRSETLANPYYGPAMQRCGDVRATVGPGERLAPAAPPSTVAAVTHHHD
ncbi:MAG: efflux RND transporter periplasmic adaptor subunit [Nannocystaceae bacterium]|nr:efflux RND transporter periplasmic adaptor subunit [Nannocystaceae bacterium]